MLSLSLTGVWGLAFTPIAGRLAITLFPRPFVPHSLLIPRRNSAQQMLSTSANGHTNPLLSSLLQTWGEILGEEID